MVEGRVDNGRVAAQTIALAAGSIICHRDRGRRGGREDTHMKAAMMAGSADSLHDAQDYQSVGWKVVNRLCRKNEGKQSPFSTMREGEMQAVGVIRKKKRQRASRSEAKGSRAGSC